MYQSNLLSPRVKQLMETELGAAPGRSVMYNPQSMYALVTKHHTERYGEYIVAMRRLRRVFRRCGWGRELLITDGPNDIGCELSDDSSSDEDGMQYLYRGDDKLCMGWRSVRRVLSAYGGGAGLMEPGNNPTAELVARLNDASRDEVQRHVNRHLPPALQQLGGIVLRPQGDTQRGYVIPTVVLHYATGMAQMAEMYGEDIGAGDLDEWVCRPGDWGVSGAVGSQMRTLVGRVAVGSEASEDGAALPILAIDANTASTETLELIAAYCAALAAEHVELDGKGLLNTDALPVYPTIAVSTDAPPSPSPTPAPPADSDDSGYHPPSLATQPTPKMAPIKVIPITTDWVQPFPYLSASMLLPSAYPPRAAFLHNQAFNVMSESSLQYLALGGTRDERESFISVVAVTGMGRRNGRIGNDSAVKHVEAVGIASLTSIIESPPLVKPLEAVFALEYLLPHSLHGRTLCTPTRTTTPSSHRNVSSSNANHLHFENTLNNWKDGTLTNLLKILSVVNDHDDEYVEYTTGIDGLQFDSAERCGSPSMEVCGGYQVEPRLGFIPYTSSGDAVLMSLPLPPPSPAKCVLQCTMDQFIKNAVAKTTKMGLHTRIRTPFAVTMRMRAISTLATGGMLQPVEKVGVGMIHGGASRSVLRRAFCGRTYSPAPFVSHDQVEVLGRLMLMASFKTDMPPASFSDQENTTISHIEGVYATTTLPQQEDASNLRNTAPSQRILEEDVEDEEAALIRASLARTSDVMKVANFLGLAPLVELCGLVIAILLRGRSLGEVREMFTEISSTAT